MITMIAAAGENNSLGKDGDLVWHLPDDFKRFKKLTTGHHIVMGRKTWESFPRPLPNRTHLVITRDKSYKADNTIVVHSIEDALKYCKNEDHIFIIGGGEIYNLALPFATHIELTRVHETYEADAFFPEIDLNNWQLIHSEHNQRDEKHLVAFTYETYTKKDRI